MIARQYDIAIGVMAVAIVVVLICSYRAVLDVNALAVIVFAIVGLSGLVGLIAVARRRRMDKAPGSAFLDAGAARKPFVMRSLIRNRRTRTIRMKSSWMIRRAASWVTCRGKTPPRIESYLHGRIELGASDTAARHSLA